MGTDGNGSTPKKFNHGLVQPLPRVFNSPLWKTEPGRIFVSECLDRHINGDHGDIPTWVSLMNQRFASNEGIEAGGMVAGGYLVPEALRLEPTDDLLMVVTTTSLMIGPFGEVPVVTTLLLFVSDLP